MAYIRRNHPPAFPALRFKNRTNQVVYISVKTATANGVYLAPSGQTGDSIVVRGVDLSDERTVKTLRTLILSGKVAVDQVNTLWQAFGVTTTLSP